MRRLAILTALSLSPLLVLVRGQVAVKPLPTLALGQPCPAAELKTAGQPNWIEGRELNVPFGVAVDSKSGALYVADSGNHRVLAWRNAAAAETGAPADLVIGQTNGDKQSTIPGVPSRFNSGLDSPTGLAVDSNSRLYVLDAGNNRIVRYSRPFEKPPGTITADDFVIGQATLSANEAGIGRNKIRTASNDFYALARGLAFDSQGNLYVTDTGNHRVLRFPVSSLSDGIHGPDADAVLGQTGFDASTPFPFNDQSRVNKATLRSPTSLAFDTKGNLFVADAFNRVAAYQGPAIGSLQTAARIVGIYTPSPSVAKPAINEFTLGVRTANNQWRSPGGVFTMGDSLFVADTWAHRILRYNPLESWPPEASGFSPDAKVVIGQDSFGSETALINRGRVEPGAQTLFGPVAGAGGAGEVYVADHLNHRILVFPDLSAGDASANFSAKRVLGQTAFEFGTANLLEGREFSFPAAIAVDRTSDPPRLYISDTGNNRVLAYADARRVRAQDKADIIIGQVGPERSVINWPAGSENTRNSSGLLAPAAVAVDAQGNLWVADQGNSRVLRFPRPFASPKNLPEADLVLGQADFTQRIHDVTASLMRSPSGLAFTNNGDLLVSDSFYSRVLLFQQPFQNGMQAVKVFGQPNMGSADASNAGNRLNSPRNIATDSDDRLYVVDRGNTRVQVFGPVTAASSSDATAVLSIPGFRSPGGIHVEKSSGEIWLTEQAENSTQCRQNISCVTRLPKFDALSARGVNPDACPPNQVTPPPDSNQWCRIIFRVNSPIAVAQDGFGSLFVADAFNRVSIHPPLMVARNAANGYSDRIAPGMWTSLYKLERHVTPEIVTKVFYELPNPVPLPTELSDLQVLLRRPSEVIEGNPAPLYFVSPGQINFLMPNSVSGDLEVLLVRLSTRQIFGATQFTLTTSSPAFFTAAGSGTGQIAAINQNGSLNSPANGARPGEVIALYATGAGFIPGAPADGDVASGQAPTSTLPIVFFNSRDLTGADNIPYSGLSPGSIGLWQINVKVPDFAPPGENVVIVRMNNLPSNYPGPETIRTTVFVVR
jgi:uncharacterized protein (TIGR03437 family)